VPIPELQRHRVLVVDDSATSREALRRTLQRWHIEHAAAASAPEALHLLEDGIARHAPYDIVLIDQGMSGVDGLTLARSIHETSSLGHPTTILLTSQKKRPSAEQMHEAGLSAAEFKPISEQRLRDSLLHALGAAIPTDAPQLPEPQATQAPAPDAAAPRILVAEDNIVNQKIAMRFLKTCGYHATLVGSGLAAIAALRKQPYDLVFMDVQMPEMDGLEATRTIRRLETEKAPGFTRRVGIIAMTANALSGDREICLAAGMDDYVAKPLVPDTVQQILTKYLRTAGPSSPLS
jgi:two-component system sensor histidine kinase/response regulator